MRTCVIPRKIPAITGKKQPVKKLWVFVVLFVFACTGTDTPAQLQELTGYWEIEKVKLPDGRTREYTLSPSIDYFEIKPDSTGFRKKLQPQLNGRFLATDDTENFVVETEGDRLIIHYTTEMDEWQETLLSLDKYRLVIKNKDHITYFYKRFEAIDITR